MSEIVKLEEIYPREKFFQVTIETECIVGEEGKEKVKKVKQIVLINADTIPEVKTYVDAFMRDVQDVWRILKIEYSKVDCVLH